ncbi:MAG: response regulator, partial [Planctomycetes bacterium]|nr:response regulator [Planctomycetota bacterium]
MQKILVIEDNPFARQVTRDTLESAGFVVLEAPDGRTALELMAQETPRVILLDMMLPDTTGLRLISQLRELPGGSSVPVVAFSGYLSRLEEARGSLLGFTEFLPKPFEPEQLLRIVHAYMPAADTKVLKPGQGRRLVLADDDADQRRLTARHLELSGFLVSGVPDGATALAKLRASPADAVVSDILMPNTDGFQLCLQIRQDPQLRDLPVVLVTNNYLDPEDQLLAEKVGANAYMTRAAGLHAVVQAVLTGLREKGASRTVERATELDAQYTHRVIRQLERQAALNQAMVRRCSLQATALSVLGGITDALAATHDLPAALGALLTQCAEAVGVAMMAVYLSEPGGRLAMLAASDRTDVPARGVASAFGHLDLIRHIMETRSLTAIPSSAIPVGRGDEFLAMSGGQSAIVAPFVPSEGSPGALLLVAENPELTTGDWLSFARTLSAQLGLGIALARAFKGLAESDQRNRSLLESAGDGILVLDDQGNTLNVNRRAEELLGQPRATLVGKACRELLVPVAPQPGERTPAELLGAGAGVAPNLRLRRPDGSSVVIDLTVTPVSAGRKQLALVGLHDVTERNLLEQELRQAQKMEAMGRLAGGVAHDFNNLLSAILGFSDLAQSRIGETGVVLEYLREIHEAGNRAAALTDQLLAFSRKKVLAPKVLDPNAVVNDIVTMLQRLIGEDIRLVTQLEPAVAPILADPGQLQQVLMNLAVNSRDAMPHGGELRLNTANAVLKEAAGGFPDQVPPGTYVLLEVA